MRVLLANGRGLSEAILVEQHLVVAEERSVGVEAQRNVESLVRFEEGLHVHEVKQVDVKEETAIVDEENLIGLVVLVEKNVVIVQVHGFETWDDRDQEILRLVFEELDAVYDLAVRRLDDVGAEGRRELLKHLLPVMLITS